MFLSWLSVGFAGQTPCRSARIQTLDPKSAAMRSAFGSHTDDWWTLRKFYSSQSTRLNLRTFESEICKFRDISVGNRTHRKALSGSWWSKGSALFSKTRACQCASSRSQSSPSRKLFLKRQERLYHSSLRESMPRQVGQSELLKVAKDRLSGPAELNPADARRTVVSKKSRFWLPAEWVVPIWRTLQVIRSY